MTYEDYIQSDRPIRFSAILLGVGMLLPLGTLWFEGWHSGVVWAVLFAVQMAIFVPGVYLLRPVVFWVWLGVGVVHGVTGLCVIQYYWSSAPDWMDAEIPVWFSWIVGAGMWVIQGVAVVLGSVGWIRYLRRRTRSISSPSSQVN